MKFGDIVASIEDCISGMDTIPAGSVDLVATDPPYNLQKSIANDDLNEHEFFDFTRLWVTGAVRSLKKDGSIYVMCGVKYHPYVHVILEKEFDLIHVDTIIWAYSHSVHGVKRVLQSSYDPILLFAKSNDYTFNLDDLRDPYAFSRFDKGNNRMGKALPDVWYIEAPRWNHPERHEFYKKNGRGDIVERGHPMQKPVTLFKRMIQLSSNPGETVLDPFTGSGTSGVAAIKTGRKYIGFEVDPQWEPIINRRLSLAHSEKSSKKLTDFVEDDEA
jgi:site-specific DNA-methyltransferase (adenine-specific)